MDRVSMDRVSMVYPDISMLHPGVSMVNSDVAC